MQTGAPLELLEYTLESDSHSVNSAERIALARSELPMMSNHGNIEPWEPEPYVFPFPHLIRGPADEQLELGSEIVVMPHIILDKRSGLTFDHSWFQNALFKKRRFSFSTTKGISKKDCGTRSFLPQTLVE